MPLTTLIVDDEPLARANLRLLLQDDRDVSAIHEAGGGADAVDAIRRHRPDLVFLDVQMPGVDGFAVVGQIGAGQMPMPAIVFITAHDQYAVRAFDINAIDYLLKPVTATRFGQALERAKARLQTHDETSPQIASLLETLASQQRYVTRLAVRAAGKTIFVDIDNVEWIRAAENYVELHTGQTPAGGTQTAEMHLLHVPIGTLHNWLDPKQFVRIHRSFIVRQRQIVEVEPVAHGEYTVRLRSGVRFRSGRTYHATLKSLTENPF